MKRASRITQCRLSALLLAAGPLACQAAGAPPDEDPEQIASALEQENGGLDMQDEAPYFGEPALFDEADVDIEETYDDSMATDADVSQMIDDADAVVYSTTIVWGQFPADPEQDTARQWSGRLVVNRGAIIVRSRIAFERPTDRLLARDDRRSVRFTSATRPHGDGLRLAIVDPTPLADEPLTLSYQTADGEIYSVAVAELVDGPVRQEVDGLGNEVIATAMPRPVEAECRHGFLAGRWQQVAPRRGRLLGRVVSAAGEPLGHVRGIYGERRNGERVFFGKYIDGSGAFRGLFRGRYRAGRFAGRWIVSDGDRGALGGLYREGRVDRSAGRLVGGHILGRWAESSCGLPVQEGR